MPLQSVRYQSSSLGGVPGKSSLTTTSNAAQTCQDGLDQQFIISLAIPVIVAIASIAWLLRPPPEGDDIFADPDTGAVFQAGDGKAPERDRRVRSVSTVCSNVPMFALCRGLIPFCDNAWQLEAALPVTSHQTGASKPGRPLHTATSHRLQIPFIRSCFVVWGEHFLKPRRNVKLDKPPKWTTKPVPLSAGPACKNPGISAATCDAA